MIGGECARCILTAAAIAFASTPQDERADRLATAELRVRGPAIAIAVEVPGAGRAVIDGRIPAGSEARFDVALPAPALAMGAAPRVTCEGGGSAEIEPLALADGERRARFEALPRGLRARAPIAPPEALPPKPSPAAIFLVAGLFAAGWALRRRGPASLLVGAAGAALVLVLGRSPAELAVFTVAEGQGPVPAFVLVESARGRLPIGTSADLLRLESRPSAAELVFRGSPSGRDLEVEASDANRGAKASRGGMGTTLFAFRDGSSLSAAREQNGVFDLEQVWLRESGESEWTALGPWPRQAPLPGAPESSAGRVDPPGWLIAGLPQGPGALVGGGGRRWMRWVDLPEAR